MTATFPPKSVADTPATALRRIASRAHRMLRQAHPADRREVLALLDEVSRSRRLFEPAIHGDLLTWFDRLEGRLAGLLDDDGPGGIEPEDEPAPCAGVAIA